MKQKELIKKFLNLEDEDEVIVEAWNLFIAVQKAFRGVEARIISRRDGDNVQRNFIKYMKKQRLKTLDEEEGLKTHEFAIIKEEGDGEGDKSKIKPLNLLDLWLLVDYEDVCVTWMADEPRSVKGFSKAIIDFLEDPDVTAQLRDRLIEKDKGRGEKLLKTILEDRPAEVNVHSLLVEHYEREGRLAEAEVEYKRILSKTDSEVVWANYGDFMERMGRYEEAFDAFKKSLDVCERTGWEELRELLKESISRVERMKNLEGEEARKAREYMEAAWLIDDMREFAEKTLMKEIEKSEEEYKDEEGIEEIVFEDVFDFINWFLFNRKLHDGRTPGMVYAEEKGLSEEMKEKIKGLGNPVKGTFEIVGVDHASFKLVVKNRITDEEYELICNVPGIRKGQTFTGNIYPWGDFYITGGVLKTQDEDLA